MIDGFLAMCAIAAWIVVVAAHALFRVWCRLEDEA